MANQNNLGSMIISVSLDNAEFTRGLDTINRTLKTAKSEAKAQIAAYEAMGDTLNATRANLDGLNKQYELSAKKQEELRKKYEKAVATYGEASTQAQRYARQLNDTTRDMAALERKIGSVTEDLQRMERETAEADTKLGKFRDTASDTAEKLDGFANKLDGIASKGMGAFKAAAAGITAGVVGIGAAAVKAAVETSDAGVKIENSLGSTNAKLGDAKEAASALFKDGYGESMEDVSNAVVQVTQNIDDLNGQELEGVTKSAMALADTFDSDINEVSRGASGLIKEFGLSADEAMDLLADGAQSGLNKSNELFDNMAEYAPLWGEMGYSAEEMFSALKSANSEGMYNLDYANDLMKEVQIRAKDGSKTTADAMAQLSTETQNVWKSYMNGDATVKDVMTSVTGELSKMDDQTKASQIGVALMGTKFEDLESDAVYALGNIDGDMKNVSGTADKMKKNMEESFSQKYSATMRQLQQALLPLGNTLLDLANKALPKVKAIMPQVQSAAVQMAAGVGVVVGKIKSLIAWYKGLDDNTKTWIKRIALATAALVAFGVVMSPVIKGLSLLVKGVSGVVKGFSLLANGGIKVLSFFRKGSGDVSKFGSALSKVRNFSRSAWDGIKLFGNILRGAFSAALQVAGRALTIGFNGFRNLLRAARALLPVIRVGLSTAFKTLLPVVGIVVTAITLLVGAFKLAYKHSETFRRFIDKLKATVLNVWDTIKRLGVKKTIALAWTQIKKTFESGINFVKNKVTGFKNALSKSFADTKKSIVKAVSDMWTNTKKVFTSGINFVKNKVTGFKNALSKSFADTKKSIVKAVSDMWTNTKKVFTSGINFVKNKVTGFKNALSKSFADTKKSIVKAVSDMWTNTKKVFTSGINFVKNKVTGFKNALSKSFADTKKSIVKAVSDMWTNTKKVFTSGINFVKNKVNGFKTAISNVYTSIKKNVSQTISSMWTNTKKLFTSGVNNVKTRVTNLKNIVKDTFENIFDGVKKSVTKMIDEVKNMPQKMKDAFAKGKKKLEDGAKTMATGAVSGVQWGLNKVIGGANKVLGFFGSDKKIKEIDIVKHARGTNFHPGGAALVNDGRGKNYRELVATPDGKTFVPQGRNVLIPDLPRGSQVLNGEKTSAAMQMGMIPKYATGIGWLDKVVDAGKNTIGKVKDWATDIWDVVTSPDAMKKVLAKFANASLPEQFKKGILPNLVSGASNKVMDAAKDWLFDEKTTLEADSGGGGDFGDWKPFKGDFNAITNSKGVYDYLYDLGQQIVKKFKSQYSGLYISSGRRKTSSNTGGVVSDHTSGLALDLARGGVRDDSYYQMARTLANHPYLKFVIGSNKWAKNGGKFTAYPYAKTSDHSNHLHISARSPAEAKKANAGGNFSYKVDGKGSGGVSASGLNFIKKKEGFSSKFYDLGDGMLTIGWGSAVPKSTAKAKGYKVGQSLPQSTLDQLFKSEVGTFASQVKSKLNAKGFKVKQNQFDMLVSYAFNRGIGGFNQLLSNSGSVASMGDNIVKYWGSNKKFYSGLIARRREESRIYKHGYANGGIVNRQELAWVAENNKPEAIIPLDRAKRGRALQLLKQTARRLGVSMDTSGGNSTTTQNSSNSSDNSVLKALLTAVLQQNELLKQQINVIENKQLAVGDVEIYQANKRQLEKETRKTKFAHGR